MMELALGRASAAFAIGALLGTLSFWGLWITTRRLPTARHPGTLAIISYVARTGGTLAVLAWVAHSGNWVDVLFCLGGFTLPRLVWTRLVIRRQRDARTRGGITS